MDISNQELDLKWLRYDHDITGLATKPSFQEYNDSLLSAYGSFYRFYNGRVMNFGDIKAPNFQRKVMGFLTDKHVYQLFKEVDSLYPHIESYRYELETAFKYYQHYFPNRKAPVVVSMIAGLNRNIVVTDSVLAVGLDMYMGDSNRIYTLAQLPAYITNKSTGDYMVYDMMRGWLLSEFEPQEKKDDVLSQIVHYGKAIYAMDAMFPFAEDHYKIGFLADQIDWCKANETTIWAKLIEEQALYSTDLHVVRTLTGPGPFTAGFPRESPAQLGYWMGWQIVRKYMDENPNITLEQLMQNENAQAILRDSKYKPR